MTVFSELDEIEPGERKLGESVLAENEMGDRLALFEKGLQKAGAYGLYANLFRNNLFGRIAHLFLEPIDSDSNETFPEQVLEDKINKILIYENSDAELDTEVLIKNYLFEDLSETDIKVIDLLYNLQYNLTNFFYIQNSENYANLMVRLEDRFQLLESILVHMPDYYQNLPLIKFESEWNHYLDFNKEIIGKRLQFKEKSIKLISKSREILDQNDEMQKYFQKFDPKGIAKTLIENNEIKQLIKCASSNFNEQDHYFWINILFKNITFQKIMEILPFKDYEDQITQLAKILNHGNSDKIEREIQIKYLSFLGNKNIAGRHLFQLQKNISSDEQFGVNDRLSSNLDTIASFFYNNDNYSNFTSDLSNPANFLLVNKLKEVSSGHINAILYYAKPENISQLTELFINLNEGIANNLNEVYENFKDLFPHIFEPLKGLDTNRKDHKIINLNYGEEGLQNHFLRDNDEQGYFQLLTPLNYPLSIMSSSKHELILEQFKVSNAAEYVTTFSQYSKEITIITKTPFLFNYFTQINESETSEQILNLFPKKQNKVDVDNLTEIIQSITTYSDQQNIHELCKYLQISSYRELASKPKQSIINFIELFQKLDDVKFNNLTINLNQDEILNLFDVMKNQLDQEGRFISHELSYKSIIKNLVDSLDLDSYQRNPDLSPILLKCITSENYNKLNLIELTKLINSQEDTLELNLVSELLNITKGVLSNNLYERLKKSNDFSKTKFEWNKIRNEFRQGHFNINDPLHVDLEYITFCDIVTADTKTETISNNILYQSVIKSESLDGFLIEDELELRALVYEGSLLRKYIEQVQISSKEQNRELWIVPNLSYGLMPVLAISNFLDENNIPLMKDVKVGSTQCHDNPYYVKENLFGHYTSTIINNQPNILIVDGTNHLVSREEKNPRYPDAHQGYLNYMMLLNILINPSLRLDCEFANEYNYLFNHPELKNCEKHLQIKQANFMEQKSNYTFHFWNTANMNLSLRRERQEIEVIEPYDVFQENSPKFIFCCVGVLHDQLEEKLKEEFEKNNLTHQPAFFDDDSRITSMILGFNNFGLTKKQRFESILQKFQNEYE